MKYLYLYKEKVYFAQKTILHEKDLFQGYYFSHFCFLFQEPKEPNSSWMTIWELPPIQKEEESLLCKAYASLFTFMPGGLESNIPCDYLYLAPLEMVFYGGSFNPWHQGHAQCLEALKDIPNVILIPDHNPQKDLKTNEHPWQKMCELKRKSRHPFIYSGFIGLEKANPTYFWIKKIKEKNPTCSLSLLLGADSFNNIHTWINNKELLALLDHLYIVDRGIDISAKLHDVSEHFPHLSLQYFPNNPYKELSSTKLRQAF